MSELSVWVAEPAEAGTVARLLIAFRNDLGYDWPSDNAFLAGVEKLIEDRKGTVYLLGSPDPDSPPAGVAQLRFRHGLWRAGPARGGRTAGRDGSPCGCGRNQEEEVR